MDLDLFTAQAAPAEWLVIATGVAALAVTAPRRIWLLARNAITIAHEGGHGLVALTTGRRLERSGCTRTPAD